MQTQAIGVRASNPLNVHFANATGANGSTRLGPKNKQPAHCISRSLPKLLTPRAFQGQLASYGRPLCTSMFCQLTHHSAPPGMRLRTTCVKASANSRYCSPVSLASSAAPSAGQPDLTHPCIVIGLGQLDQPLFLQCRSGAFSARLVTSSVVTGSPTLMPGECATKNRDAMVHACQAACGEDPVGLGNHRAQRRSASPAMPRWGCRVRREFGWRSSLGGNFAFFTGLLADIGQHA